MQTHTGRGRHRRPSEVPGMLAVWEAADALGVTERQVERLARGGRLAAQWTGSAWLVDADALIARVAAAPRAGRPRKLAPLAQD